ncbi:MAG: enoyl-CoA hydratase-related protein [Castellaniella sp.]|uniref:enoyl-CoA hydratase-related protein n=1 Tax=Castellaniella sp. TaxID=1955812 RepID=UPI002A360C1A|nr:enoyl-CoA hydratase-related protein [Castellaniella sp.]MDY0308967.1 enoyl-CoA hydratase-related protein [Castellaniella sp.]
MAVNPGSATGRVHLHVDGAVATVTLDHPGRLNAITVAMWTELAEIFGRLSADEHLRCVVVRGAGGHFAAGADIREFPQVRADQAGVMAYHRQVIAPALRAVGACIHPVVAAIEGVCVGGGLEIASRCDLRLAVRGARFGAPINRLGFPMAPDEMRGLLELAGRAVTLEILLEGRVFDADEALAKGLLTRVVAGEALEAELTATVSRLCAGAPLAARLNKSTAARLTGDPAPLSDAEWRACFAYADGPDHRQGVQAFLQGTDPVFTGE